MKLSELKNHSWTMIFLLYRWNAINASKIEPGLHIFFCCKPTWKKNVIIEQNEDFTHQVFNSEREYEIGASFHICTEFVIWMGKGNN